MTEAASYITLALLTALAALCGAIFGHLRAQRQITQLREENAGLKATVNRAPHHRRKGGDDRERAQSAHRHLRRAVEPGAAQQYGRVSQACAARHEAVPRAG